MTSNPICDPIKVAKATAADAVKQLREKAEAGLAAKKTELMTAPQEKHLAIKEEIRDLQQKIFSYDTIMFRIATSEIRDPNATTCVL